MLRLLKLSGANKFLPTVLAVTMLGSGLMPAAEAAYKKVYDHRTGQYYYVDDSLESKARRAWTNPMVKQAVVGAAVGAGAGLLSDRSSVLKGAAVGAATGVGTGLVDRSNYMADKPLLRTAVKGAAIGTGAGAVTGKGLVKGAVVGAGAGAGLHYLKDYMNRNNYDRRWW